MHVEECIKCSTGKKLLLVSASLYPPALCFKIGLSLYVSNIGSATFIGVAGTASLSGYSVISYEFTVSHS